MGTQRDIRNTQDSVGMEVRRRTDPLPQSEESALRPHGSTGIDPDTRTEQNLLRLRGNRSLMKNSPVKNQKEHLKNQLTFQLVYCCSCEATADQDQSEKTTAVTFRVYLVRKVRHLSPPSPIKRGLGKNSPKDKQSSIHDEAVLSVWRRSWS